MTALAWVDGVFVETAAELDGAGAFETLGARGGELPLWERHLARLGAAAAGLKIECVPPRELRDAARELLARRGHQDDILRITLVAGASAGTGGPSWGLTTRARHRGETPVRLHAVRIARSSDERVGFKSTARATYASALAQARAAGADDALLVAEDGTVEETTTCNVFVGDPAGWATPPLNGRIVPGIARALLLERLAARGVAVGERAVTLDSIEAGAELWVTNAVYGPRPAVLGAHAAPRRGTLDRIWAELGDRVDSGSDR